MKDMDRMDVLMPKLAELMPPMIATMTSMKQMMLTMQSSMNGLQDQMQAMMDDATAMGQGVRRVEERRLVLPAAGGLRQPGIQARPEDVRLTGWKSGAVHHLSRG